MVGSMMKDVESHIVRQPAQENRSSTSASTQGPADTGPDEQDVVQLREALRAAERAYRRYLAELRQGDVEPVDDWSTWYADYLLGLR
jgi:hypothetical protein